jgi:acyl-CoA thioesterase
MKIPEILAASLSDSGAYRFVIPAEWMQGRTSYGGLSSALALETARRLHPDLAPLRSAAISFVGPLAGEVTITARTLRKGRNATWIAAEATSDAGIGLTASFVFMGPVESALHLNDAPPPAGWIAPEDAQPLPPRTGPGFIGNFEVRFAMPRADGPLPELCWWVRLRDRAGLDPMVEMMAIADALPPGVMPLLRAGPVSSMTWLVNLLTPQPTTRDGWWMVRSAGNYAENGCSSQDMGVWNADGEPVAMGMQSIALFG